MSYYVWLPGFLLFLEVCRPMFLASQKTLVTTAQMLDLGWCQWATSLVQIVHTPLSHLLLLYWLESNDPREFEPFYPFLTLTLN